MTSFEQARRLIASHVAPLASVASALEHARERILRQEIVASEDSPGFNCASVDGYAVGLGDGSAEFHIVAEVRSGEMPTFSICLGQCARVYAGSALPDGATQVLRQDQVRRDGQSIFPLERNAISHVRRRGEDIRGGDWLLHSGRRLHAAELALLAQLGVTRLSVSPSPRAIHLVTGDELVEPQQQPGAGQVRDSNSILVSGLLAEAGAQLVAQRLCGDQLASVMRTASALPDDSWDLLLISGGADRGDSNFGQEALGKLGFDIHFQGVEIRPGKALVFGTRGRQCGFVIPGNPVSHLVAFHTAVRLSLECMEGAEPTWPMVEVELEEELPESTDEQETYWPAQAHASNGRMVVRPLACHSAGDLCAVVSANALLRVLPGAKSVPKGERADCLLLRIE